MTGNGPIVARMGNCERADSTWTTFWNKTDAHLISPDKYQVMGINYLLGRNNVQWAITFADDYLFGVQRMLVLKLTPHLDREGTWSSFSAKQILMERWYDGFFKGQYLYALVDIRRNWRGMGILPWERIRDEDWFSEMMITLACTEEFDNDLWNSIVVRNLTSKQVEDRVLGWFGATQGLV